MDKQLNLHKEKNLKQYLTYKMKIAKLKRFSSINSKIDIMCCISDYSLKDEMENNPTMINNSLRQINNYLEIVDINKKSSSPKSLNLNNKINFEGLNNNKNQFLNLSKIDQKKKS